MSNKVPCGGFYLDDMLGIDENGKLGVNGGEPFKQLVTDGDGNVKWDKRLAYADSRLVVGQGSSCYAYVLDEIPDSEIYQGNSCTVWVSTGNKQNTIVNTNIPDVLYSANGALFVLTDNVEYMGVVFPKRGIYFGFDAGYGIYTSGISFGSSVKPEIEWDGKIEIVQTIDSKFIPSELNEVILPSSTSGSKKKFKITVNDSGTITATEVTT